MKVISSLIGALLLCALFASPAHADDVPRDAIVDFPVYRAAESTNAETVVQIEAPGIAWGIRRTAKRIDAEVPGLSIRIVGTCASSPDADLCVQVVVGNYSADEMSALSEGVANTWIGLCTFPEGGRRVLHLNEGRTPETPRAVAAHELGHALGLSHHRSRGITSTTTPWETRMSDQEAAVLRDWYSVVRYADGGH